MSDCDNGPTKKNMWDHREEPAVRELYALSFGKRPAEELYDLRKDPNELHNVAEDPQFARTKTDLAERLATELRDSADPRPTAMGSNSTGILI